MSSARDDEQQGNAVATLGTHRTDHRWVGTSRTDSRWVGTNRFEHSRAETQIAQAHTGLIALRTGGGA